MTRFQNGSGRMFRRSVGSLAVVLLAATVGGIVAVPSAARQVTGHSHTPHTVPSSTPTTSPTKGRHHPPRRRHKHRPGRNHPGGVKTGPIPLGVYAGPGDAAGAYSFAAALGRPVPYALDYLDASSWTSISDPQWQLQRWAGSGFKMIWGVPMLPAFGATLAQGAVGTYDGAFELLAENMVASGEGSSILMLGWAPAAGGVPWAVSTYAEAGQYTEYWRRIVDVMRAVPGAQFSFAWDAGEVGGPVPSYLVYPGDAHVDMVATMAFDNATPSQHSPAARWDAVASGRYGPDWAASFAARHGKRFMVAQAGLDGSAYGGRDDPDFFRGLLSFSARSHTAVLVIWNFGTAAVTSAQFTATFAVLQGAS